MTTGLLRELMSERDRLLDRAIAQHKFSASRREHYAKLYDRDPDATVALIERLTPVPPDEARGTGLV